MDTTEHPTPLGPVYTEQGDTSYRLVPTVQNLVRACYATRDHLAEILSVDPKLIQASNIVADGVMIGFCLTLPKDSPTGYGRITYDTARCWTYCGTPGYPPLSPDCAFVLRYAPPLEAVEAGAVHIAYRARQIAEKRGVGAAVDTWETRQPVSA